MWFKPHYPLPRHTHDVDCLYYVVSGTAVMGNQELRPVTASSYPQKRRTSTPPVPTEWRSWSSGTARSFDIKVTEDDPARWDAMIATANEQRSAWQTLPSPRQSSDSASL